MTTDARRLMRLRAVTSKEHSIVRLRTGMAKGFGLGLPSIEPRVGPQQCRPYEGSSRMKGNLHVRFLGGRGRATARAYPAVLERHWRDPGGAHLEFQVVHAQPGRLQQGLRS